MSAREMSAMRTRWLPLVVVGMAACVSAGWVERAEAQTPAPRQNARKPRTIKESPLELKDFAQERREGQVLPGDPSPEKFAAPMARAGEGRGGNGGGGESGANGGRTRQPRFDPGEASGSSEPGVPAGAPGTGPAPVPELGGAANTPIPEFAPAGPSLAGYEPAPIVVERGPVRVRVLGVDGNPAGAEWRRAGDSAWNAFGAGAVEVDGRFEVRTGLGSSVRFMVDDGTEISVGRLARALVERQTDPNGNSAIGLELARGQAQVRPGGATPVNIRTPDQAIRVLSQVGVEYNAFAGTRPATVLDR